MAVQWEEEEIRYCFITDNIRYRTTRVEYCSDMMGDFFMKALQGSFFHKFCSEILNLNHEPPPDQKECVGTPGMDTKIMTSEA